MTEHPLSEVEVIALLDRMIEAGAPWETPQEWALPPYIPARLRHVGRRRSPIGSRMLQVFPEAEARRLACGCPHAYALDSRRGRSFIEFDAFFLPRSVQERCLALYERYVRAWIETKPRPRSLWWSGSWHDYVHRTVRTEDLPFWVGIFRLISPLAFNEWDLISPTWKARAVAERAQAEAGIHP